MYVKTLPGSGRVILLLHGWAQTHESLLPLAELLSPGATCHLPDLPGFGASPTPDPSWGTAEYAALIVQWLDEQGIAQAEFVAHSFGARVALRVAAASPERVASLSLIGAAGLRPRRTLRRRAWIAFARWLGRLGRLLPRFLGKPILAWRERTFGSADYRATAGDLRAILSTVLAEDLQDEARGVRAPTLLIYGREDEETPVEMGERFRGLIEGSCLLVLDGKGHFPFAGGGAHLCATKIKAFHLQRGSGE
jgi:pimeloyl-ACP methyl ester carboxylesterase